MKVNNGSHSLVRFALTGKQDYPLFAFTSHLHLFLNRKGKTMNDTRTIKVKADAALAQAIAGKHIKRWSSTTHSNGRKYVNVTFEEVSVLGKID